MGPRPHVAIYHLLLATFRDHIIKIWTKLELDFRSSRRLLTIAITCLILKIQDTSKPNFDRRKNHESQRTQFLNSLGFQDVMPLILDTVKFKTCLFSKIEVINYLKDKFKVKALYILGLK